MIERKINSFAEIDHKYDVIINCTGLGAKYLCNDHKLVPMRGQVLKVTTTQLIQHALKTTHAIFIIRSAHHG